MGSLKSERRSLRVSLDRAELELHDVARELALYKAADAHVQRPAAGLRRVHSEAHLALVHAGRLH